MHLYLKTRHRNNMVNAKSDKQNIKHLYPDGVYFTRH